MSAKAKKADGKGRITLPELANAHVLISKVSANQFLITKATIIPEPTAWFFESAEAQALVKQGLKEAKAGQLEEYDPFEDD